MRVSGRSEGNGERDFPFHRFSFSVFLSFEICSIFVLDQNRANRNVMKYIYFGKVVFHILIIRYQNISTFLFFDIITFGILLSTFLRFYV